VIQEFRAQNDGFLQRSPAWFAAIETVKLTYALLLRYRTSSTPRDAVLRAFSPDEESYISGQASEQLSAPRHGDTRVHWPLAVSMGIAWIAQGYLVRASSSSDLVLHSEHLYRPPPPTICHTVLCLCKPLLRCLRFSYSLVNMCSSPGQSQLRYFRYWHCRCALAIRYISGANNANKVNWGSACGCMSINISAAPFLTSS
jgi:hypothetical protein